MLTPEQIIIRRQDNQLRELKKQNAEMAARLADIKKILADIFRFIAPRLHWKDANDLRKIADELDAA